MRTFLSAVTAIVGLSLLFIGLAVAESNNQAKHLLEQVVKQHSYPLKYNNQQFSGSAW